MSCVPGVPTCLPGVLAANERLAQELVSTGEYLGPGGRLREQTDLRWGVRGQANYVRGDNGRRLFDSRF